MDGHNVDESSLPEGWFLAGSKASNYDAGVTTAIYHEVTGVTKPGRSAFLRSRPHFEAVDTGEIEGSQGFGTVMQQFVPIQLLGKRVRMRAWLRFQNVIPDSWCGLWLRLDEPNGKSSLDNMYARRLQGTNLTWTSYDIVMDVPEKATNLGFGFLLHGTGSLWCDDFSFEVVDKSVPLTLKRYEPINLSF